MKEVFTQDHGTDKNGKSNWILVRIFFWKINIRGGTKLTPKQVILILIFNGIISYYDYY
jgi:hypothetical protein